MFLEFYDATFVESDNFDGMTSDDELAEGGGVGEYVNSNDHKLDENYGAIDHKLDNDDEDDGNEGDDDFIDHDSRDYYNDNENYDCHSVEVQFKPYKNLDH